MTDKAATSDLPANVQLEDSWCPASTAAGSTASELDIVWGLDRLANAARRSKKEIDEDKLWRATFELARWWCVPLDVGDGRWAPAAGEIDGVNTLFAFSIEQRARQFAIDQSIITEDDDFKGAPTAPIDIVRQADTYIEAGIVAIMLDGHKTGHFLPMKQLAGYWKQLCGPLPE